MSNILDDLQKSIENLSKTMYNATKIFLANPNTILKLNLNEIPNSVWFISNINVKEEELSLVINEDLKKELYRFCEENPDRFFRGEKELN